MTEGRRLQLHLGKCIEDLDKLHNVPDLKTKRTSVLCKSALKLFERAEQDRERGDEENSYIYYMKYLRIIAFLSSDKEYLKDKSYYNNMLGIKNPNKAIDAAEKLKKSLIERYASQRQEARPPAERPAIAEPVIAEPPPAPAPAPSPGLPGPDEVTINSEQLYPLLKAGKLKILILDCRPEKDYLESHINYPGCISVPEECISPGQSANVLEQSLPSGSRAGFATRAAAQLVVLLDWTSAAPVPGHTLFLLKTILLRWDVNVQYARPPLALRGGYEDWLLRYPAFTTNPQVAPPQRVNTLADMLDDIDYPSWSEAAPVPARPSKPGEPIVDRSSKAAAVQVYEERARSMQRILDRQERIADGALTLQLQRIEAEQDWERVRVQRESEQRDELRSLYQLREQEIISQLMQLENKQYDMEQENQQLRDQLEEYQRREREEAGHLADHLATAAQTDGDEGERHRLLGEQSERALAAARARIAAVTEQRDQLDRQREQMEAERKRKLADARDKRKPHDKNSVAVKDLSTSCGPRPRGTGVGGGKDEDGDTYMSSPVDSPTGLTRSLSSPTIANNSPSSEDEERPAPVFDRSTKPRPAAPPERVHDFEPYGTALGRGLTGLKNLGNTCYMNSILQCLNNTTVLVTYFCTGQYLEHINRSHSSRGMIAEELAALVRELWNGQYRFIAAKDLRNELGKHQRAFRGNQQQDSHEFLTILMDWLHLDLQFAVTAPHKDNMSASEKAWHAYTRCMESLILRLFYGQIKSTVRCTVCGKTSVTYDSFSSLSLELPANATRCTLTDCLKLYLNGEPIPGWNCPNCKQKRDAVKKLDISRLPPVLVVHFKRFYLDRKDVFTKKMTYIDFPLADLDMRPFCLHAGDARPYQLYAVSNHYGNTQSGHYTAACKSSVYGKWYLYDDHAVNEMPPSEVKSSAAYVLFYSACGTV